MFSSSFLDRWMNPRLAGDGVAAALPAAVSPAPRFGDLIFADEDFEMDAVEGFDIKAIITMMGEAADALEALQIRCLEIEMNAAEATERNAQVLAKALEDVDMWKRRATLLEAEILEQAAGSRGARALPVDRKTPPFEDVPKRIVPPGAEARPQPMAARHEEVQRSAHQTAFETSDLPAAAQTLNRWRALKQSRQNRPGERALRVVEQVERAA